MLLRGGSLRYVHFSVENEREIQKLPPRQWPSGASGASFVSSIYFLHRTKTLNLQARCVLGYWVLEFC